MSDEITRLKHENEKLKAALTPYMWDVETNEAWHKNIPDVGKAFNAIRRIALEKN